jgi:Ca-activated chloride channel family protein
MSVLFPAALAFAIIIPIILLFYFMRTRRQERVVSSTLLWQQAIQDTQASRPWQRLRVTPLLLLQLLAALVIVLVLIRPAILLPSPIGGDTIIILQASASMQATDVSPNRFEAAKSRITDLIDGLGPGDRVSLIAMTRTPKVVIANSSDQKQLSAALASIQVTNQDADIETALSLASALAAGHADAKALVVGDGHVLPPTQELAVPMPVSYLEIGSNAPNAALLALASRSLSGSLVALAQIANYGPQPQNVPVALYADGRLISVQTASLGAGASGTLTWGPLPPGTQFLRAHILVQDALQSDNDAWAIVNNSMQGRILLVTAGNAFLEAALRLQSNIDLFETTPQKYANSGAFDLTIFDGFVPPVLPGGNLFFVNPPAGSYIFGTSGQEIHVSQVSPAGSDAQSSQLLNEVDLSTIHTLRASHLLTPQIWMQPVLVTPETPLLIAGQQNTRRVAALSFDLHDSDLPLQPSFPILMYNLVNWFLPSPVPGDGQISPGTPVTIQPWPGTTRITVAAPDHADQPITLAPPFPAAVFDQTDRPGIYVVTQDIASGQQRQGTFVVNLFDPLQSNLAPVDQLPVLHSTAFGANGQGGQSIPLELRELWPWLAALLLLLLCAEWWLFSRGYIANRRPRIPHNPSARRSLMARFDGMSRYASVSTTPHIRPRPYGRWRKYIAQAQRNRKKGGRDVRI